MTRIHACFIYIHLLHQENAPNCHADTSSTLGFQIFLLIPFFHHSFYKCLLSIYYVPYTVRFLSLMWYPKMEYNSSKTLSYMPQLKVGLGVPSMFVVRGQATCLNSYLEKQQNPMGVICLEHIAFFLGSTAILLKGKIHL